MIPNFLIVAYIVDYSDYSVFEQDFKTFNNEASFP